MLTKEIQDLTSTTTPADSYLVAGCQSFGQNDTRVPITGVSHNQRWSRKDKVWGLHAVIEILDDELHQVFPAPKLAQMIERGEDLEFLQ